jgi:hypothetical protein
VGGPVPAPAPAPSLDREHIELYYKTRDDLNEQSASADTRALSILTLELALTSAAIVVAPSISSRLSPLFTVPVIRGRGLPLFLRLPALAADIVFVIFVLGVLATLGATAVVTFLVMSRVLTQEFQVSAVLRTTPWSLFWRVLTLRFMTFLPKGTPDEDRGALGLPFSPHALVSSQDLSSAMGTLDIPAALIADIQVKARIVLDKRAALHVGLQTFALQLFLLACVAMLSLVGPALVK